MNYFEMPFLYSGGRWGVALSSVRFWKPPPGNVVKCQGALGTHLLGSPHPETLMDWLEARPLTPPSYQAPRSRWPRWPRTLAPSPLLQGAGFRTPMNPILLHRETEALLPKSQAPEPNLKPNSASSHLPGYGSSFKEVTNPPILSGLK